jgi:hypothetical protein
VREYDICVDDFGLLIIFLSVYSNNLGMHIIVVIALGFLFLKGDFEVLIGFCFFSHIIFLVKCELMYIWRIPSSGMLSRVTLVRTDVPQVFLCSMCRLLVIANVVPTSLILITLMMEALHSSETLVLT